MTTTSTNESTVTTVAAVPAATTTSVAAMVKMTSTAMTVMTTDMTDSSETTIPVTTKITKTMGTQDTAEFDVNMMVDGVILLRNKKEEAPCNDNTTTTEGYSEHADVPLEQRLQAADAIISQQTIEATPFIKARLRQHASRNWDIFYKHNTTNFFKDRHWTDREFAGELSATGAPRTLLEVGCGVGNLVWPLLDADPLLTVRACDFSRRAVDLAQNSERRDPNRCEFFVCDVTQDPLTTHIPRASVDVAAMVFVLSAMPPERVAAALRNVAEVLREGGRVVVRDYAHGDLAQVRFKPKSRVERGLYMRHDGTLSYFFRVDELIGLFADSGLECVRCGLCERRAVNRKENKVMDRVFVQGVFERPRRVPVTAPIAPES